MHAQPDESLPVPESVADGSGAEPLGKQLAPMPEDFPAPWNYLIPLGRRLVIWGIFFAILYLLRSFLPLVFLTFVFAYIAEHGVDGLAHRIRSRRIRTAIVFSTMIAVIAMLATFLAPELKNQAVQFVDNLDKYEISVDKSIDELRGKSKFWDGMLKDVTAKGVFNEVVGRSSKSAEHSDEGERVHEFAVLVLGIFKNAASVMTTFLLALLFAFLIVADLRRIGRGVMRLQRTKIHLFYDEVSRSIFRFGSVLGHFLEAQLVIALANTALTSIGLWAFGLPNIAFLAGVVFICSFIPVAGVFLSTAPICLVALDHGGFSMVLWAIAMIGVVHAIEAYVLNPLIFGAHLHMNPVLVLAVLLIGHKLFGIWGLLLGVPTVTYIFGHAIQPEPEDELEVAFKAEYGQASEPE